MPVSLSVCLCVSVSLSPRSLSLSLSPPLFEDWGPEWEGERVEQLDYWDSSVAVTITNSPRLPTTSKHHAVTGLTAAANESEEFQMTVGFTCADWDSAAAGSIPSESSYCMALVT